ncbi:cellulose synthase complex outer membrane protein BcsC [Cronobacter dublinensis]|uniref:cellulose synthase complex outer membrane protein BcsC n=1 Tax=Cronobacter dublinensis TaxID=413497 RepID=UPI00137647BD|nr:cellulose synthase complex outer membrane protein BcsC [Cronobacter dublinensis]NCH60582.1 cellulose biosynthesis protein BcsC [Cronobacter dublinensis]
MHKFALSITALALGVALAGQAQAQADARQQLLEQVRLGESAKRDDLVRQSLYRLELISPDDPDVIAARMRYLLRQGDNTGAQEQFARLGKLAPQSPAYQQARITLALSSPEGRQQLQQARLLGTTGHTQEALAAYQKLFNGAPPDGDLAIEYWALVAKDPARRDEAIRQMQALNARAPGNDQLRTQLALQLFSANRQQEGFSILEQMAKSGGGRETAADLWYQQIQGMPASDDSVAALERFLQVFSSGETADKAKGLLAEQQSKLADPAYRARMQGIAKVEEGQGGRAVADLSRAVQANPNDSEALGALAQAYSQQGNRARAVPLLEQALKQDPNSPNSGRWQSLLQVNRYWLLIQQGDAALKANNLAQAQQKYQQAATVDNTDSYAVLGLGDVAVARKDDAQAERYYRQALRMDNTNSNAIRGLANLYRRQSPERADAFIATLSVSQRRSIEDIERSLANDRLAQQAGALESQGRFAEAAALQRQRLALDPESVWITYRLASDLAAAGQRREADMLLGQLAQRRPTDPEQVYAYGLYLSGSERERAALTHLNTLPRDKWTPNILELAQRLQTNELMATANRLRDNGQEAQAVALLRQQPASDRIDLTLADWAQQRGDNAAARAQYQAVLARTPGSEEARLGLAEALIADGDNAAAREQLAALTTPAANGEPRSPGTQRRLANAQAALGDTARAQQAFAVLAATARTQPPSQETALVLRDAARFQRQNGEPQQALQTYRDAMVASAITPTRPVDNDTFTRLTRNDASDDWLKRSVRGDAADLYRQQDLNVTLQHDYWGSSGTAGYSDLKANTTMLQVDAPLRDGRLFLRTDAVNMNPGSFGDSPYKENWGTCTTTFCSGNGKQRASGVSVAAGWQNETWDVDLGTTPIGFDVVDIVGGVSYSSDLGPIGYTVNAHRRPISSSMLAFAGQRDAPSNTGTTWGGVRATGGGASISYDRGEAHGVWASLNADQLTGKNVADNWRVRWMSGYYYKLINENNQRLTIGLNNMVWHYEKDLSGYSLGQGGYYSPQEYVSFAVPVAWRMRTENWSWELGASGSWSHSRTQAQRRYPLSGLIPPSEINPDNSALSRYADKNEPGEGGSSNGWGYTANALIERRITSNWSVGAAVDIQQAKDYTPSNFSLFIRYSQAGWQGDMDMPPRTLTPYADR